MYLRLKLWTDAVIRSNGQSFDDSKNISAEPLPYTAMQGPGDMLLLVSAE